MKFDKKELYFLPLGGSGEIGMNVNLYHYNGKWLMIDLGAGFADDNLPGIDIIAPDISFVQKIKKDFLGVLLTHAHEDHLGAIPYLWEEIKCPIYATSFTAAVLRAKLSEMPFGKDVKINEIDSRSPISIGPFDIKMISLTHSIPEMHAMVIRTEFGSILHTGDWKFDPNPMVGSLTDEEALSALSKEKVIAAIGDSTNAYKEGHSGSEGELRKSLMKLLGECKQAVAVTTFASNIARVDTIARVAAAHNRKVVLAGRSLYRITEAAKQSGYLNDIPPFLSDKEAERIPRDKLLILCTGCQGETNAATNKLAYHQHQTLKLKHGDTVIFSSKIIPGNEKRIYKLFNRFIEIGVEVITENDHFVHVSGHPCQDELKHMYKITKPDMVIPVHGEKIHMHEHAKLARSMGIKALEIMNGDVVKLAPGDPKVVFQVPVGYFAVDGSSLLPPDGPVMKLRRRIMRDGVICANIVLSVKGDLLAKPSIFAPGVLDSEEDKGLISEICDEIANVIEAQHRLGNDEAKKIIRTTIKRISKSELGKFPDIQVNVVRV